MQTSTKLSLGIITFCAPVLLGCPKEKPAVEDTSSGKAGSNQAGKQYRIAVIPKGTENSFWQSVKAGADAAAKETGDVDVIWQGPATEGDVTEQVNIVQTQIANRVDGIVLAATDAQALTGPAKSALDKKIPLVTIDSGVSDKNASNCYIATDNVRGGREAAQTLAKEMGEKGAVGILIFKKGSVSSDEREQGFLEGIKKYPNIHLVANLEAGDTTKAVDRTSDMLTAHPDITGIFASNEPNGIGAANVFRQRKLAGKVKLVAFDASDQEMKALDEGTIQALIVQDPFQMGFKGVMTVRKFIRKEPVADKFVDSGLAVVTKQNENSAEIQKLLHPMP